MQRVNSFATWCASVIVIATLGATQSRPIAKPIPTPEQIIGFKPGTDRKLADVAQIGRYFAALAAASPRVQLFTIGQSTEGRDMILAAISSEENLKRLARFKDIARQLADARPSTGSGQAPSTGSGPALSDEQARQLAREGKAIVWIDFGLHATEVAPAQASAEVAFTIATSETDEVRRIRDNVILVTVPVMNPDGLDIVANWYRNQVGTPFEGTTPPVLYQKYAGHDNNRDWYMQNLAETRVITNQLYHEWFPQVLYNHHQSGQTSPRIWTPPMDDPVNPNMHPLINRGITLLGVGIQQRLEQEGKKGAEGYETYSNWWNGGMRSTPCFHNVVSILTEVASSRLATPIEILPSQLPRMLASGEHAREPSTWNPSPWPGGKWTLRDQMDYLITGTMAVLRLGAEYREDWLYNRYQMARDQIALGKHGDPYAYVIPTDQHDGPTAVKLVEILNRGAVEVSRAKAPFTAGGKQYAAGSFVVLMAQPNRGYAKDLLEPQHHPNRTNGPGGTPKRPYDMAGWTLAYQMGVRADVIKDAFTADLEQIPEVRLKPDPTGTIVSPSTQVGSGFSRTDRTDEHDRRTNFAVKLTMDALKRGERVGLTPLQFITNTSPGIAGQLPRPLHLPKVGVYKSYVASMDEGWVRYVLEQFDVPYTSIENKDVRGGNLKSRFEALVLPNQSVDAIVNGHAPGSMPPEYVGGIGLDGVAALRAFVEAGGTLLTIDGSSELPIQYFNIPVRNTLEGVRNTEFYCPGSLLKIKIDTTQPLAAGLPAEQAAFFVNGRAFDVGGSRGGRGGGGDSGEESGRGGRAQQSGVRVLARYAAENELLMSGWINGGARIAGKAAALDVAVGRGRVVLTGFGITFRGQPHGTFKFLFNPILESAVDGAVPVTNQGR